MIENKTTRNCAIYCRVSTTEQNLDNQIESCKTFASLQKYKVYKVYMEKISGTKDSRPELNDLMFDSRKGLFDVVIVWKLDRLGRSLRHLLNITEEWQKQGIDFVCVSQGFDTTTASGKMVFQILGAIAEFERELISERTKAGFIYKEDGTIIGRKKGTQVGKRGKDRNPRSKSGYYLRWTKKKGG